jgi:hypothetical protein
MTTKKKKLFRILKIILIYLFVVIIAGIGLLVFKSKGVLP